MGQRSMHQGLRDSDEMFFCLTLSPYLPNSRTFFCPLVPKSLLSLSAPIW